MFSDGLSAYGYSFQNYLGLVKSERISLYAIAVIGPEQVEMFLEGF